MKLQAIDSPTTLGALAQIDFEFLLRTPDVAPFAVEPGRGPWNSIARLAVGSDGNETSLLMGIRCNIS